jgi:hypothetical protein
MLKFGPYTKMTAQVAVARLKAALGDTGCAVSVRISVDEAGLSQNDRLLLQASRGERKNGLPPGGVDEALSFLSWFQLGEQLQVFHVEVDGEDAGQAERLRQELA